MDEEVYAASTRQVDSGVQQSEQHSATDTTLESSLTATENASIARSACIIPSSPAIPQRHAANGSCTTPKQLQLPNEMIILIVEQGGLVDDVESLCNLRATCRTFAGVLWPSILNAKQWNLYLDDKGVEEVRKLLKSPYASYVRRIGLGVRRIVHEAVVFRCMDDDKDNAYAFWRLLQDYSPLVDCPVAPTNESPGHYNAFRTAPDPDTQVGCRLLPEKKDYTPAFEIITSFRDLLYKFENLVSLTSNDVPKHTVVIIVDNHGRTVQRGITHLPRSMMSEAAELAHCSAKNSCDSSCSGRERLGSNARTLLHYFSELTRAKSPSQLAIPLRLTELRLNVAQLRENVSELVVSHRGPLLTSDGFWINQFASVVRACTRLKHLSFSCYPQDTDRSGGAQIKQIMSHLMGNGHCFPNLESLELTSIEPSITLMEKILKNHKATLSHLRIRKCSPTQNILAVISFAKTLRKMPELTIHFEDYYWHHASLEDWASTEFKVDKEMGPRTLKKFLSYVKKDAWMSLLGDSDSASDSDSDSDADDDDDILLDSESDFSSDSSDSNSDADSDSGSDSDSDSDSDPDSDSESGSDSGSGSGAGSGSASEDTGIEEGDIDLDSDEEALDSDSSDSD